MEVIQYAATLTALLGLGLFLWLQRRSQRLPLPPGPKPKFLSGNVHQLPRSELWKVLVDWSKAYGSPIISWRIFGRKYIALNDFKTVCDLFEARASIYSDRPVRWMNDRIMKRDLSIFNMSSQHPYFKTYRRLLQGSLNARGVAQYQEAQEEEMRTLIRNLASSPENFIAHFRRNAGAVILRVAYGWTVTDIDDKFVVAMTDGVRISFEAARPGRWLVDIFPILRFVPSWFPGAGFKQQAAVWKKRLNEIDTLPHAWAKEQIASGNYIESFTSGHLQPEDNHTLDAEEEIIIKNCSLALYAGGADTTVAAISSFVMHMMNHQDIQRKAQKEVDRIVGKSRLPSVKDETALPYVTAVLKEVLRISPVSSLGLPHRVLRDDEYAGYHIPAGATVVANIWCRGILHDENLYPDPMTFNPERFMGDDTQTDPRKIAFGFGRRVCPGSHFAEVSLLLNLAAIFATFDIRKPLDEMGKEYDQEIAYVSTITTHPQPFKCRFVPRPHASVFFAD